MAPPQLPQPQGQLPHLAQAALLLTQALLLQAPAPLPVLPLAAPRLLDLHWLHTTRGLPAPQPPALQHPCHGRGPCHALPLLCQQQQLQESPLVPAAARPGLLRPALRPHRCPSCHACAAWRACPCQPPAELLLTLLLGLLLGLLQLPPPSCCPSCRGCACRPGCCPCPTCRRRRCRPTAARQRQAAPHRARQPAWPSRTLLA